MSTPAVIPVCAETQRTILENGICVITDRMPGARSISIGVLTSASPQDESPEQRGLAHLTEHLMFQGTSNRDSLTIARMIDSAGGNMSGFTSRDFTCYHATVLDDYGTYVLDLIGDILLNSIFPESDVENEKKIITGEIAQEDDNPSTLAHNNLKGLAWGPHPLGRRVAGNPESVARLSREDVIYFVHQNYMPNRMIVSAAGNVRHDEFVEQVRDALWQLTGDHEGRALPHPVQQGGVLVSECSVGQAYFAMGLEAPPYDHKSRYELHVLNAILGSGLSSRLFVQLREEKGMVYDVASDYHAYRDAGLLVIEGSTSPENLMPVLGQTLVELWKLAEGEEPVTDEELWKVKMNLRGQHLISGENSHTRMSRAANQEFYFGRQISGEEVLGHIEQVTATDIQRIAQRALGTIGRAALSVAGPAADEHYAQDKLEKLFADSP